MCNELRLTDATTEIVCELIGDLDSATKLAKLIERVDNEELRRSLDMASGELQATLIERAAVAGWKLAKQPELLIFKPQRRDHAKSTWHRRT